MRVEPLRSEFGLDLTYENLVQRVTRSLYWRGGMDSEFGPLEESASHHIVLRFKVARSPRSHYYFVSARRL